MALRSKTYKTGKGSIEVYGGLNDDFEYHTATKANEVGIYVTRNIWGEDVVNERASVHLTPNQARKVGARLLEWANAIENRQETQ